NTRNHNTHYDNRITCISVVLFIFDLKPHVYYNCTVHSNEVVVMLDRLQLMEDRYEKLNELLSDPDVVSDINKLRDYSKEQSDLEKVVSVYRKYKEVTTELADAEAMSDENLDEEMAEMVQLEVSELSETKDQLEEDLKILLLPKDPNDDRNVIVEIRAAAGGDEAGLFAGDLYRMYSRFAESNRWKTEVIEADST